MIVLVLWCSITSIQNVGIVNGELIVLLKKMVHGKNFIDINFIT
jgi:hypothetical protein